MVHPSPTSKYLKILVQDKVIEKILILIHQVSLNSRGLKIANIKVIWYKKCERSSLAFGLGKFEMEERYPGKYISSIENMDKPTTICLYILSKFVLRCVYRSTKQEAYRSPRRSHRPEYGVLSFWWITFDWTPTRACEAGPPRSEGNQMEDAKLNFFFIVQTSFCHYVYHHWLCLIHTY